MKKINWGQKLTSRKFWAAVVGFVTGAAAGLRRQRQRNYAGGRRYYAGATLIAYIVGEGMVDASRALDEGEANHDA